MKDLKNYAAAMLSRVKEEVTVMDLDTDDEDVLCGQVKERMNIDDTSTDSGEANRSNMQQIVCATASGDDDDDWDTKIDHQYMKLLDSFREDGTSYLRDNPLRSIRYDVDNGGYDERKFKAVKQRSREDRNTTIRVTKKKVESKPRVETSAKKKTKEADSELRRRESLVTEKSVEKVKRNSQHNVEASKKKNLEDQHNAKASKKMDSEDQMVVDENYRSYLTMLAEKSKSSRSNPGKEIQVKCEQDTMSLSDSDIIAVEDRPFLDEEDSPFVPSKNYEVIDLDEECGDQRSSWFRKEIMKVLKQPYTEKEYLKLYHEASVRKSLIRCRELRDGRELTYKTDETRPSYLDRYPDFKRKLYESLREEDRLRALNLLRGFIFYLEKVVRDDAFKPWRDHECLKITSFGQKTTSSSIAVKQEFCTSSLTMEWKQ